VYVTRDSSLLLRPLQGAFLIPPVPPVVLINPTGPRGTREIIPPDRAERPF